MAKVRTYKCPHCLAPLPISTEAVDFACRYCGQPVHIERGRQKPVLPPDVMARTIYVAPPVRFPFALLFAPIIVLSVLGSVGATVFRALFRLPSSPGSEVVVEKLPATCPLSGTLVVRDVTGTFEQPPIATALNCKIKIQRSKIKAPSLVKSTDANVTVEVEDSTLEGDVPISLGQNARITAARSKLVGKESAIVCATNCKIAADATTVSAKEVAISVQVNGNLAFGQGTKVTGKEGGIRASENLELELVSATVNSEEIAISAENNAKVRMSKEASVRGDERGIVVKHNLRLTGRDSNIEGGDVAVQAESASSIELRSMTIKGGKTALAVKMHSSAPVLIDTKLVPAGEEVTKGKRR